MAIRKVGTNVTAGAGGSGSSGFNAHAVSEFGALIPGDLIVISSEWVSTSATTPSWSNTAGVTFVQIGSTVTVAANRYHAAWYGFVTGFPAGSGNITTLFLPPTTVSFSAIAWSVYRGVDSVTPLDGVTPVSSGPTAAGSSHSITGVTTATDGALAVIALAANDDNGASGTAITAISGTGYVIDDNFGTSLGVDGSVAIVSRPMSTAGASGTLTVTSSPSRILTGIAFSLRPKSSTTIEEIFVGRQLAMGNPASGLGTYTRTPSLDTTNPGPLTPEDRDVVLIFLWHRSTGTGYRTPDPPSAPWVELYKIDEGDAVLQIYGARYGDVSTFPTFDFPSSSIERTAIYAVCLRGLDPNDILDVATSSNSGGSTTPTFPAVTPTVDDVLLVRGWFTGNNGYLTAGPSAGSLVIFPYGTDQWTTSTDGDQSAGLVLEQRSGGAGVSTGTATVTNVSSALWTAFTLALNPAPPITPLVAEVDAGAVVIDATLVAENPAVSYIAAVEVDTGAAIVDATLRVARPNYVKPRRELVWVYDLSGARVGVIA